MMKNDACNRNNDDDENDDEEWGGKNEDFSPSMKTRKKTGRNFQKPFSTNFHSGSKILYRYIQAWMLASLSWTIFDPSLY